MSSYNIYFKYFYSNRLGLSLLPFSNFIKHFLAIKFFLLLIGLSSIQIFAASPMDRREQMRLNFGAGHPVFRLNLTHFGEMYPGGPNSLYGHAGNSEEGMMTRLIVNAEALVMINNLESVKTDGFSDKEGHFEKKPLFLNLQASYDYFNLSNNISVSLAQSANYNMGIGFLGFMRGYTYLGAVSRSNRASGACVDNVGIQAGLSLQNSKHALQLKVNYFPSAEKIYSELMQAKYNTNTKILMTAYLHQRISDRVLYEFGVENNCPKTGFSYIGGNWRLAISARMFQQQAQYGFTLNHSF